jgi:hypothetical protein
MENSFFFSLQISNEKSNFCHKFNGLKTRRKKSYKSWKTEIRERWRSKKKRKNFFKPGVFNHSWYLLKLQEIRRNKSFFFFLLSSTKKIYYENNWHSHVLVRIFLIFLELSCLHNHLWVIHFSNRKKITRFFHSKVFFPFFSWFSISHFFLRLPN